jgi:hypothetical protein
MSGETDISGWKVNTAVVREAVAHVLLENVGYDGKRVSFEQLVTPLNVLAGADGGEDIGQINATKQKSKMHSKAIPSILQTAAALQVSMACFIFVSDIARRGEVEIGCLILLYFRT